MCVVVSFSLSLPLPPLSLSFLQISKVSSIVSAIEATIASDPLKFPPNRTASFSTPSRRSSQDTTPGSRRLSKDTPSNRSSDTPTHYENGNDNLSSSSALSPEPVSLSPPPLEEVMIILLSTKAPVDFLQYISEQCFTLKIIYQHKTSCCFSYDNYIYICCLVVF